MTLLLASITVFLGVHALPGDPALVLAGEEGANNPALLHAIRVDYQLDKPLPVQYVAWLRHVVHGDFGHSVFTGQSVIHIVLGRSPITLELAALALLFAIVVGVTLGVLAARKPGGAADMLCNVLAFLGISVPGFWIGMLLIELLSVHYHLLPSSGFVSAVSDPLSNLEHLVLPMIVLGTGFTAVVMMQTRSAMIETLGEDFIRTARAKGLSETSVIFRHGLRNSLLTVITVLGLQLGVLIGGSVVTEQLFLIPGFGALIVEAVNTRDYPVVQAVALIAASGYIVINFLVDLMYTVLDPRVRLAGSPA